jgi:hypothetical protein
VPLHCRIGMVNAWNEAVMTGGGIAGALKHPINKEPEQEKWAVVR